MENVPSGEGPKLRSTVSVVPRNEKTVPSLYVPPYFVVP